MIAFLGNLLKIPHTVRGRTVNGTMAKKNIFGKRGCTMIDMKYIELIQESVFQEVSIV